MAKKYTSKYTGPEIDAGIDKVPVLEGKLTELESEMALNESSFIDVREDYKERVSQMDLCCKMYAEVYRQDAVIYLSTTSISSGYRLNFVDNSGLLIDSKAINTESASGRKNYCVELPLGKVYVSIDWTKFNAEVSGVVSSLKVKTIGGSQCDVYPFVGGKLNLNLFKGFKNIFIKNRNIDKEYFISSISTREDYTYYTIFRISEFANGTYTTIAEWKLVPSAYANRLNEVITLDDKTATPDYANGHKLTVVLQEIIDGGIYYNKSTSENNPLINLKFNWGAIDSESSSWGNIEGKPTFAKVAETGSYNDLKDKPVFPEGSLVVDSAFNVQSQNALSNQTISYALKVATIADLKEAMSRGYKSINLDTGGQYVELGEKLTIPKGVTITAYNAFIRRATGYDNELISIGARSGIYGLTIDGNRNNVTNKYWGAAVEIHTTNHERTEKGTTIKDCRFVNCNCAIMYYGWNNLVENCVFDTLGSAGVHYSGCYNSSVKGCFFRQCCLEGLTYQHSEGAILWSDYTAYCTVENNYFQDCPEAAIGGLDSSGNNNNTIVNNKMERTGGIAGTWGSGEGPNNLIVENNVIVDSVFGEQSLYSNLKPGILLMRVTNSDNIVIPFDGMMNIRVKGNTIINSAINISGVTNAVIENNFFVNLKLDTSSSMAFTMAHSSIKDNVFVDRFHSSGLRLKLYQSIVEGNTISTRNRAMYFTESKDVVVRDNYINQMRDKSSSGEMWNASHNSTKIDFLNNTICSGGYGGNSLVIPDWSVVENNIFFGGGEDWGTSIPARYVVGVGSKYVRVRNNVAFSNVSYEGTSENGCVDEGNAVVMSNPSALISRISYSGISSDADASAYYLIGSPIALKMTTTPDNLVVTCKDHGGNTKTLIAGSYGNTYQPSGVLDENYLPWVRYNDYLWDRESGVLYIPNAPAELNISVA